MANPLCGLHIVKICFPARRQFVFVDHFGEFLCVLTHYIEWIYYGLSNTDLNRVSEQYRKEWQLCPVELIEKVIRGANIKTN